MKRYVIALVLSSLFSSLAWGGYGCPYDAICIENNSSTQFQIKKVFQQGVSLSPFAENGVVHAQAGMYCACVTGNSQPMLSVTLFPVGNGLNSTLKLYWENSNGWQFSKDITGDSSAFTKQFKVTNQSNGADNLLTIDDN